MSEDYGDISLPSSSKGDDDMATMTTSPMTDGQIERTIEIFRAQLRKHASEFHSDAVQEVFGQREFALELVGVLRKRVEVVSNMIVRRVKVDRTRTPQQALDATGRKQYIDRAVVNAMPRGEGEEVDVFFFDLDYGPTVEELDREYNLRGLKADPIAQMRVNVDDPAFADQRPNGCQWGLKSGVASFATFDCWFGERYVFVYRLVRRWVRSYRFGGVRK